MSRRDEKNKKEKGNNKFLYFIISLAIFTWFFFVFPPMFILMYNQNTSTLYSIWAGVLLVLIIILIVLYSAYRSKKR